MTILGSHMGSFCASAASQGSDLILTVFFNVFEGQLTTGFDREKPQLGPLSSSGVFTCTYLACPSKRLA